MKIRHIALGGLFVLGLSGCQREQMVQTGGDDDVITVNVVESGFTRCSDSGLQDGTLLSTRMIVTEAGDTMYLSVYLSDMDDFIPQREAETKGAPIYFNATNKNLGTLYGNVYTDVFDAAGTPYQSKDKDKVETEMTDVEISYDEDNSRWQFTGSYYWPIETGVDLYFCSMAPGGLFRAESGNLITDRHWDSTERKYSFKYTMPAPEESDSPNDAMNQPDVLVGVNRNCRDESSVATVSLKHALTAVRFVMGDKMPGNLKSISLNNFFSRGTATYDYSSGKITWDGLSDKHSYVQTYSIKASDWKEDKDLDSTTDKEKTFMVIPQSLSEDAELSIFLASALHPEVLTFKALGDNEPGLKNWATYAGKVITFKLSSELELVSVKITDECSIIDGYGVKSNIKIVNDGTAPIYVRAQIVGNWVNVSDQILASWKETNSCGEFKKGDNTSADLSAVLDENWKKGNDGFYYYRYYINAGETLKHNMFDTFTVKSKPLDIENASWAGNVNMQIAALEMNILVQAVRADEDMATASTAWGSDNLSSLKEEEDK